MPFEITNKRGEIVGFDPDLAALMAKDLGASSWS
jgi:polar amino acid transport system substrate-binding protein